MDPPNVASSDRTVPPTIYNTLITANRAMDDILPNSHSFRDTLIKYDPIPRQVMQWEDFNFQSLTEAYGDILSSSLGIQTSGLNPTPHQNRNLTHLKSAFAESILHPVLQALEKGKRDIADRLHQEMPNLEIVQDTNAESVYRSGISLRRRDDTSISTTPASLVVSCFYHANAWNSSLLLGGYDLSYLIPLRRLVTYCRRVNTRYGFILTEAELVVVRFSGTTAIQEFDPDRVEWKSIPLGDSGRGVLTAKLSLWFLAMMSLHTKYQTICTPEQLLPVNHWWRYRNCELRVVFRHHISMREVAQPPDRAVVEDRNLIL